MAEEPPLKEALTARGKARRIVGDEDREAPQGEELDFLWQATGSYERSKLGFGNRLWELGMG